MDSLTSPLSETETYNYVRPDDTVGHTTKDVKPYGAVGIKWGNVTEHAGVLYR